jgi:hypothetical protein
MDINRYLVWYGNPMYPNKSAVVNAYTQEQAEAFAAARVAGTTWYVISVTLMT